VREIKFRPKIAEHDYDTKKNHVERFLRHKDKVKITSMFRGREVTHPERGTAILDRLAGELAGLAVVEQHPTQEGRNMTMMMAPSKAVLAGKAGVTEASTDQSADGAHVGDVASSAIESPRPVEPAASNGEVARSEDAVGEAEEPAPSAEPSPGDAAEASADTTVS